MAKKFTHVHKYQRVKWGKNETEVFRCMLPGCSHYVHPEFVINRKTICHGCGNIMVMTKDKALRNKPKCDTCMAKKRARLHGESEVEDPITSQLDDLLKGLT